MLKPSLQFNVIMESKVMMRRTKTLGIFLFSPPPSSTVRPSDNKMQFSSYIVTTTIFADNNVYNY